MNKLKIYILFIGLLMLTMRAYSQSQTSGLTKADQVKIDSLNKLMRSLKNSGNGEENDTMRIRLLVLINSYKETKSLGLWDSLLKDVQMCYELDKQKKKSEVLAERLSHIHLNLGYLHDEYGNYKKGLDHHLKGMNWANISGNQLMLSTAYNNLAYVYLAQNDPRMALSYNFKALAVREKLNDKRWLAQSKCNIAQLYDDIGKHDSAIAYYKEGFAIFRAIKNEKNTITPLNNYSSVLAALNKLDSAIYYSQLSYNLAEKYANTKQKASALLSLSKFYYLKGDLKSSVSSAEKGLLMVRNLNFPQLERNFRLRFYSIYKKTGNHRLALENYELYIALRDSLNNESTRKASIKSQLKHEYETKAAADSVAHAKETDIKNAELAKQEAEIKAKKNQQYALFGGLALVMIFAGFMFNRFKVTQKQKGIIELQKSEVERQKMLVEHKQKEILDSIHYARRIQLAQIPSEKSIAKTLLRLNK